MIAHEATLVFSNGVIDSKEENFEEVLKLRRKLSFSLKMIKSLENKL